MDAAEFLRAALAAGAQVEYVDGRMVVMASQTEPATPTPAPRATTRLVRRKASGQRDLPPGERTAGKNYAAMKVKLGEVHTVVMGSAISVLIGSKTGNWNATGEEALEYADNVDLPTLQECAHVAILAKHSIKSTRMNFSMSTSALCAAVYAACDSEPTFSTSEAAKVVRTNTFRRKAIALDHDKDRLGGARSAPFRRESFNQFKSILLGTEE